MPLGRKRRLCADVHRDNKRFARQPNADLPETETVVNAQELRLLENNLRVIITVDTPCLHLLNLPKSCVTAVCGALPINLCFC